MPNDIERCKICNWPLAKSVEEGCVEGNCSMRPVPKKVPNDKRQEEAVPNNQLEWPKPHQHPLKFNHFTGYKNYCGICGGYFDPISGEPGITK